MIEAESDPVQAAVTAVVNEAIEKLPAYCQKRGLLQNMSAGIQGAAIRKNWHSATARYYTTHAVEWLDDLQAAANPLYRYPDTPAAEQLRKRLGPDSEAVKHPEGWIWYRRNLLPAVTEGSASKEYLEVDKDAVSDCAARYLREPWAVLPQLEIIMVEMLAYAEALAFSDHVLGIGSLLGKTGRKVWVSIGGIVQVVATVFVASEASRVYGLWVGLLAGAAMYYFVASKTSPFRQHKKEQAELLVEMTSVYQILGHRPACPGLVRERIYASSNSGVVWPAAMPSLVEHAAARNLALWE
jgi:hypothetical protein